MLNRFIIIPIFNIVKEMQSEVLLVDKTEFALIDVMAGRQIKYSR